MASSSRRDDGDSEFPAKTPTFFKIVLNKALLDGRLEIPPAAVMKHEALPDSVFLKDPTGGRVANRIDKEMWQAKEGDYSGFLVRIFQRNTLEIDYALNSSHDGEPKLCGGLELPKNKELGDNVSVKILDSPRPKTRRRSGGGMYTDEGKTTRLSERAFSRAISFISGNPFLVVKMQPTYIAVHLRLSVSFVKRHVCARGVCDMNLEIWSGRTWHVRCRVVVYGRKQYARVYGGWNAFARENRIKVGDACVFELINKGRTRNVTLKVGIYRA